MQSTRGTFIRLLEDFTKLNSFPTNGDFCHLLITFANNFDPGQPHKTSGLIWIQTVWHSDGTTLMVFLIDFFVLKKNPQTTKMPFQPTLKYWIFIFISPWKQILLVLIRNAFLRHFQWVPHHMFSWRNKKNISYVGKIHFFFFLTIKEWWFGVLLPFQHYLSHIKTM